MKNLFFLIALVSGAAFAQSGFPKSATSPKPEPPPKSGIQVPKMQGEPLKPPGTPPAAQPENAAPVESSEELKALCKEYEKQKKRHPACA